MDWLIKSVRSTGLFPSEVPTNSGGPEAGRGRPDASEEPGL